MRGPRLPTLYVDLAPDEWEPWFVPVHVAIGTWVRHRLLWPLRKAIRGHSIRIRSLET